MLNLSLLGSSRALRVDCGPAAVLLEERGLSRPADITRPILERYQRHLFYSRKPNDRPLSFSHQRERVGCLRGLFGFLARRNQILYNPASDLELPRLRQHLPAAVLTVAECEQFLSVPDIADVAGIPASPQPPSAAPVAPWSPDRPAPGASSSPPWTTKPTTRNRRAPTPAARSETGHAVRC